MIICCFTVIFDFVILLLRCSFIFYFIVILFIPPGSIFGEVINCFEVKIISCGYKVKGESGNGRFESGNGGFESGNGFFYRYLTVSNNSSKKVINRFV